MTLKQRRVDFAKLMPEVLNKKQDGIPFRWLGTFVTDLQKLVPDAEQASCLIMNAEQLYATYDHRLTSAEEVEEALLAYQEKLQRIKALLPREGSLDLEAMKALRELLK